MSREVHVRFCESREVRSLPATHPDTLFGVAPWLPALYFAFGVVVALLGEIAVKDRQPTPAVR